MTAQDARKGEPSSRSMRNGLRPQPARLVRGSSRRIMAMRFRPANIRVINRRVSACAVFGAAVRIKTAQSSPSGTCSAPPPVEVQPMPERCSTARVLFAAANRRALALSAPFRHTRLCDGRLHAGTLDRWFGFKNKEGRLPPSERAGRFERIFCQRS